MNATGAQIRSILLGVMVFIIVPAKKNTTTIQIAILENGKIIGICILAQDRTIMAKKANMNIFINAINLIFGGYFPGNFPPIEALPQGSPNARHDWNKITIPVKAVNSCADVVAFISKLSLRHIFFHITDSFQINENF
jgi:hypothetical protein